MSPIQFDAIDNFKTDVEKRSGEKLGQNHRPLSEEEQLRQRMLREKQLQAQREKEAKERAEREQERQQAPANTGATEPMPPSQPEPPMQEVPKIDPAPQTTQTEEPASEERRNLERVPRVEPEPPKPASSYAEDMFGGLMFYGEDLSYHMHDVSKQMRPYVSEPLFRGAKSYLTYTKGALIDRMTQGQFLAYLLIGAFPPEIKNVIIKEMPSNAGLDIVISQLKEDIARESAPTSLTNIATAVQEISDQMRLMLDADLSRDERMASYLPAILYAATWLLTDRMDLREKVSPRLSFNEYLQGEQSVPSNTDSVIRAGEGLQRRLESKNNEARNGNIFGNGRRRK